MSTVSPATGAGPTASTNDAGSIASENLIAITPLPGICFVRGSGEGMKLTDSTWGGTSSRRYLSLVVKFVKNELSRGSLSRFRTMGVVSPGTGDASATLLPSTLNGT